MKGNSRIEIGMPNSKEGIPISGVGMPASKTGMSASKTSIPIPVLMGILGLAAITIFLSFGRWNGTNPFDIIKISILAIVLMAVTIFYILSYHKSIREIPYFDIILIGIYVVSYLLIIGLKGDAGFPLWICGALLMAMLFNIYLGCMVACQFVFLAAFTGNLNAQTVIYLLIISTLMCILALYMKNYFMLLYSAVIVLSVQIILLFIINNFLIENFLDRKNFYSILCTLADIVIAQIGYRAYKTLRNNQRKAANDKKNIPEIEEFLNLEFPLLEKLKRYSLKIYKHSLIIAELSENAAKAAGANERIARAGGLYHEIGRMEDKKYVEAGIKLAQEYHLPSVVTDIIRQHNLKYEKPKSPEAAIVMIAISVIATKEYFNNAENKRDNSSGTAAISIENIVNNVFQMRLLKGSLDESGLTLKQYSLLKDFFCKYTIKEE